MVGRVVVEASRLVFVCSVLRGRVLACWKGGLDLPTECRLGIDHRLRLQKPVLIVLIRCRIRLAWRLDGTSDC